MSLTTIAVERETLKLLRHEKEELNAGSFDEVIKKLLMESKKPKKSMFGAIRGLKAEFKREELDRFD